MAARQVENQMLPATRCDVDAVSYWRESPRKLSQRWYIQLCQFASSVHDSFLAREEETRGNKNWAATMSYYSIVHACRSLVFQCFGDFPCSHQHMGLFVAAHDRSWRSSDNIKLNWLSGFSRRLPNQRGTLIIRSRADWDAARRMLRRYYRETLQELRVSDSLERFGPLVADAKSLREDSNYEALLIAHERDHFLVPRSLGSLCKHLSRLASLAVDTARDALVAGLRCDPDIENDRNRIQSLAREFINDRFERCIGEKLSGETAESFRSWVRAIDLPGTQECADTIWEDVRYDLFEGKQALMKDYIEKIERFGERVGSVADCPQHQPGPASDTESDK